MLDASSTFAGTCTSPSPHHPLHIPPLFTTAMMCQEKPVQTDRGTRTTFPTRSAHGRCERCDPELTKLADHRVPALALTTRANPPRRITQICASHRAMRAPCVPAIT